jgi:hypothetical protein
MKVRRFVPPLRVTSVSKGAVIRGSAPPFAWIDGVNVSAALRSRQTISDTRCLTRADNNGRFECRLGARVRDVLRLRWRRPDGSVGEWALRRVPAGGKSRHPEVAIFRMGVVLARDGLVRLMNFSTLRPIGEPEARLRFVNRRTRRSVTIQLNAKGNFRPRTMVPADPGDVLSIYGFCRRWIKVGQIEIPPPTPEGLPKTAPFRGTRVAFRVAPIRGRLFDGRPRAGDVVQGELSNCHLAAAAAAVAHIRPEALILKAHGRSYEATVFSAGRGRRILVDRELYYRPSGELIFGQNGLMQSTRPAWWPILEKAYATALGGYHALDRGGSAHWALHMITGLPPRHRLLAPDDEQKHWSDLASILATSSPVVATTPARTNRTSGIVQDHCYTVLSCREHKRRRWITLRNPWGEMTPPGVRRWRDGVFEMPWLSFVRYFSGLSFLDMSGR